MKKLISLPSLPGYFWLFDNRYASPQMVAAGWKPRKESAANETETDIVLKLFSGEIRRELSAGEYLIGPVEPPCVSSSAVDVLQFGSEYPSDAMLTLMNNAR
jgi:hypothetical protein